MQSWPPKAPGEVLEYEFDWGRKRLKAGELIVDSVWRVASGSVEIVADPAPSVIDGKITRVWLTGGEIGEICVLTNHVLTNQEREPEWSAKLRIKVK